MNTTNPTFDPFSQPFTLQTVDGELVVANLAYLHDAVFVGTQQTIVSAVQVGASLTMLLVLLILTKADKRRQPVFWLNCSALFFVCVAQIMACLYYTSSWFSPYAFLTGDYSFVSPGAKAISIIGGVSMLLLLISIETSLVLQVHVITITLDSWKRHLILAVSVTIALIAIGTRIAQLSINMYWNVLREAYNPSVKPLVQARDICLAISTVFFSAIFCAKLLHSLRQRKRMGLTRFGPMQVVFIGATHTLVLPALFAVLQFVVPQTHIDALVLASVALCLPLTAVWAASVTEKPVVNAAAFGGFRTVSSAPTDASLKSPLGVGRDAVEIDLEMQGLVKL
ncbi:hypothetical protein ANO11243_001460 [Dothideomycetidae sp. 11243]|nr:hypothetical protein ANO11243_001460 [fungal sp. No.11243]